MSQKNRLAETSSPYLRQHADNPVDWFPWCAEALEKARRENKPILLSVGYSACHWCHVMAHESFEDQETADLMNRHFVNIKVDREERPDIDKIYQTAHAIFNHRAGGWPLTIFLNPSNLAPFFSGTYFPKESFNQMPSFKKVLHAIQDYFQNHQEDISSQADAVTQTLQKIYAPAEKYAEIRAETEKHARDILFNAFDAKFGGFGSAPKFPMTDYNRFLVYYWAKTQRSGTEDSQALYMALHTLKKMLYGGICDQLGGGFYRYSVDEKWEIPHFEKMLYDNGQLLDILADASTVTDDKAFASAIRETAGWIIDEMQAPEGGYYSALDADSEGEEGKFYVWKREEIAQLLSQEEDKLLAKHFGLDGEANFESQWHLRVARTAEHIADEEAMDLQAATMRIHRAKQKLLQHRNRRVRPGLDNKILTAWNALTIKGMAKAAIALNEKSYAESAQRALNFIQHTIWEDGNLKTSWCRGISQKISFLDDFAFLIDALLYLLQYRWDTEQLDFAIALADALLERFEDTKNGGYFFTANDHEQLLQRPRLLHDETLPSGYALAALALRRLGLLCGKPHFLKSADRALMQATQTTAESPHSCTTFLRAFDEQIDPPEMIILRGALEARGETLGETLELWQRTATRYFSPSRFCFAIPSDAENLPAAISDKSAPADNTILAYVCSGEHCLPPISALQDFEAHLMQNSARLAPDQ